jgi:hypothetical protein
MSRQLNRNFFSHIQGKFGALASDRKTSDFQGRYVAEIIQSVAQQQPWILLPFVPGCRNTELRCTTKYEYADGRWADLAIFSGDEMEARALVEIKAADIHNKRHNLGQLQTYAQWTAGPPARATTYLCHYPLPKYMRDLLDRADIALNEMSLGEYAVQISKRTSQSELVRSFLEYLYFEGLALTPFDQSDMRALHTFLGFSFLPHVSGHKKLTSIDRVSDGPKIFAAIVQNWQLLAASHADRLRSKNKVSMRAPVVKYLSSPLYLANTALNNQNNSTYPRKVGGTWWIYARSVVSSHNGRNLYHEYGLALSVAKRNNAADTGAPIRAEVYSSLLHAGTHYGFRSSSLNKDADGPDHYDLLAASLTDEAQISKRLDSIISRSFMAAQKEIEDPKLAKLVASVSSKIVA